MAISFSGLVSGLDTSSWVDAFVSVRQADVTKLQTQLASQKSTKTTLNDTRSTVSSLRTAIEKLTDAKFGGSFDLFSKSNAVSSNEEVFTATAGNGKGEVLGEVVLATHSDAGLFGIQVYTNLTNPVDPTSGIPAYSAPVQFYQTYAGISTVKVPEVTLPQGSMYSIVITNLGSSSIDYLCETAGDYSWVKFQPGLALEQSFAYNNSDGWSDLYEDGMCLRIKAHTRTLSGPVTVSAPGSFKAVSASYKQINLSWSAVSGVSGYEIYRKEKGGSYKKLGNTSYGTTSYKDGSAQYGVTYTYKVDK